ncbi:uncharacterized protein LOC115953151 isoform X2 [Quercus lobata]|uniref:uncharacterized protein LOC115953151 isoform X2 n=1 Tax=Quercus lobata TaxID=97700 RepID=UPI0012457077|nr:uncharacterized protein LOC115953151 isoform X2 [Quercus lobata]
MHLRQSQSSYTKLKGISFCVRQQFFYIGLCTASVSFTRRFRAWRQRRRETPKPVVKKDSKGKSVSDLNRFADLIRSKRKPKRITFKG